MSALHRSIRVAALAAAVVLATSVLSADAPIKTGTLAPESSIWAKTLREMGDAWSRRTGGRITLRLFPGTAGSEEQMLRSLRITRTLQAAQLSAITLGSLDDAFNVFGLPMFFESYDELDRVMDKLGPTLEQRLERQNLKVIGWGYAGWVHVFSRTPVRNVADLKRLKLFTSTGDDRMARWYRDNGFNPVPVDPSQMLASLTTGMIDAIPTTPLSALMFRWFDHAPYMLDVGIAPLMGATVISMDAWNRMAPGDQQIVAEEARKAGARLRGEVPKLDAEAIATMQTAKLTVTAGNIAEWRTAADQFGSAMRNRLVPPDVYDLALRERDAARSSRAATR
jgi:TRAP-type C4-dicarboxylate transport system substrate-binding protein